MNKNILPYVLILAIIAALAFFGIKYIKPDYESRPGNPYSLKLDSIGQIDGEKYCETSRLKIKLPFNGSKAIATDTGNNIYISGDSTILVISQSGKRIRSFATNGTATALAIGSGNEVFAAFVNRIALYSADNKLIREWALPNKDSHVTSLAVGKNLVYAADAENARVYGYKTVGTLVQTIGTNKKDELDSFILPSYYFDVAIGPDNQLWIANTGRHKLVNFYPDGTIRSHWGETSSGVEGFCGCCNPSHFAIMEDGSFITAEKGIVRVKKYNSTGIFECAIAGPEHFGTGATGLDIAINADDDILVLEPAAGLIHVFKIKK